MKYLLTKEKITEMAIRRNLPINDNYELIDSYYSPILDGGGATCANCNKPISNIAVIKNADGKQFDVGMDCAETLTNLKGLYSATMEFQEAKGIRAKVNKAKKEGNEIVFTILQDGTFNIYKKNTEFSDSLTRIADTPKEFAKKYLPDYFKNLSNPSKINYEPIPISEFEFNKFKYQQGTDVKKFTDDYKAFYSVPKEYHWNDFKIIVSFGKLRKDFPNNECFRVDIIKDGEIVKSNTFYMVRDINYNIWYYINQYLFEKF